MTCLAPDSPHATVYEISADELHSKMLRVIAHLTECEYAIRRSDGVEVLVAPPETLGAAVVYVSVQRGEETHVVARPLPARTTYWGIAMLVEDLLDSIKR